MMTIVASDQKMYPSLADRSRRDCTRSKTLGSDRSVSSCFLERKEWLEEGWRVLGSAAQYDRDHLFPTPSTNCNGCLPSELRFDTGFAMQNRVLYSIRKEANAVFTRVLHVILDSALGSCFLAEQHQGSRSAQRRKRPLGRMERTRQRHDNTCSGPCDIQTIHDSSSGH